MVEREAPRHYVDLTLLHFCLDLGAAPWFSKRSRRVETILWAYGVLPWNIEWAARLVEAMDARDREAIPRAAKDLGHYVADAHVPLHTTLNYNGQLTGLYGSTLVGNAPAGAVWGYISRRLLRRCVEDVGLWAWKASVRVTQPWTVSWNSSGIVEGWEGDLMVREQRGRVMQLNVCPSGVMLTTERWTAWLSGGGVTHPWRGQSMEHGLGGGRPA